MTENVNFKADYDIGILVLGFTRPDFLSAAIQSLRYINSKNRYPVYCVVDGQRAGMSAEQISNNFKTRDVAQSFVDIELLSYCIFREHNFGTRRNVFASVTEVLARHEYVFVVEDDLCAIPYSVGALEFFVKRLNQEVSAFSLYCNESFSDNPFYSHRFSSQAWGTSRKHWSGFDYKELEKYRFSKNELRRIVEVQGQDMPRNIKAYQNGKMDSWALPWNLYNFLEGRKMIYPPASFFESHGHRFDAERTKGIEFPYRLADCSVDSFEDTDTEVNLKYLQHYSLFNRLFRRARSFL